MKKIFCKTPLEYLKNKQELEEKGLCATGNSYKSTIFADRHTREEKVILICTYTTFADVIIE